jgi:TonB family protein
MFYRLMLSRETFHKVNRGVLLLTAVASFVLPLCVITMHKTVMLDTMPMVSVGDLQMEMAEDTEPEVWQVVLPIIFIIGVVATLAHTLASIVKVMLLIRRSERHPQPDGTILCVTGNTEVPPFSWMRYIVMNRSDYEANDAAILAHERGHIRLRHSLDVVLVDLLTALQWFNPAMWMLRQDLCAIHEYEADGEVLSQGINARQYQYLLITKAASIGFTEVAHARPFEQVRWISLNRNIGGYSIANGINHSTLKNRITMMLHKKSNQSSLLKLLVLIPIVGIALALNARTVTDYVYDEPQKQVPVKKGKKASTIKMGGQQVKVVEQPKAENTTKPVEVIQAKEVFTPVEQMPEFFDVVEQMPEYPGGAMAMFEYLAKNIHYPKDAEDQQIQGRVIATFVVMKDGSISNAKVVKSVDPLLDEEALRCINAMPNWTPGKQNGQAVNVKYTIPISFRLDKPKKEEPSTQE